ncbi:MAG: glycosyltransferase [Pseudomonadota bacterium]|nr:glycosyltransferase [Pseudomonadota bacterium]
MRIAVVHYHLQTGGVTRVIRHAGESLRGRGASLVVLSGAPPAEPLPVEVRVVPGLRYEAERPDMSPHALAVELSATAAEAIGGPPDIWHFHNHSLGKNLLVPECVLELARACHHLLLQIHDFPEDGRPRNYRALRQALADSRGRTSRLFETLYPIADHVHYAVLSERDGDALREAGAPGRQVHTLPNAVSLDPVDDQTQTGPESEARLWLYPTRAIRRKNLGEFLLWAAMAGNTERFATTRGPENPLEKPAYDDWRAFAARLDLPMDFGVGERCGDFAALLKSAHAMVTTSVAEGFGLAFLEPWLTGKAVAGRDLPEQTSDFRDEGVDLNHLYQRVAVPRDWFDDETLRNKARSALEHSMSSYGRVPGPGDAERALRAWTHGDTIDFGRLDEALQQQAILRIARSDGGRRDVSPTALALPEPGSGVVSHNRRIIEETWGIEAYGDRLLGLYEDMLATPASHTPGALDGDRLLDRFLAPERLYLLRN